MDKTQENVKKLKLVQKLGYGVGDFGSNYCWSFVASFVLIYFTNVLGVSAAVIGTIMLMSKVLDGITDVFMGTIIDHTKHKMGKARFWYFVSCFPTALCVFLIFNVPSGFAENTKYVYIFIVYTLMGAVFYTMNNIAYTTMSALVTKDPKERVQLTSYRYIFAVGGVILLTSTTSGLVEYFGGGQSGWRMVSIIYTVVCLITLLVPVAAVRELPEEELSEGKMAEDKESGNFFQTIGLLLKNKYFVMGLIYYIFMYLAGGIFQGLGIYYVTYNLGNAGFLGAVSMAGMLPTILLLPFVPKMAEKMGIRNIAIAGYVIALAGAILAYIGGGMASMTLILAGMVIRTFGTAPMTGGFNALLAEVDDYSLLKFGKRVTGSIYSCVSVGIKVGTGLGTALCGYLLEFSKFDGSAEVQSDFTLSTIMNAYFLPYVVLAVVTLIILFLFDVEKQNRKLKGKE